MLTGHTCVIVSLRIVLLLTGDYTLLRQHFYPSKLRLHVDGRRMRLGNICLHRLYIGARCFNLRFQTLHIRLRVLVIRFGLRKSILKRDRIDLRDDVAFFYL